MLSNRRRQRRDETTPGRTCSDGVTYDVCSQHTSTVHQSMELFAYRKYHSLEFGKMNSKWIWIQIQRLIQIYIYIYFREGNGTPLQYSCLENPMDGGAWWAVVHGVAKSQTQLKWLSSSSSTYIFKVVFNWKIIALQCCVGFCHTSTWGNHRYTYVPSLNLPLTSHLIPPL